MKKEVHLDNIFRIFIVIISAVIYSLGLIWLIEPSQLYSGGISGIAQILNRLLATTLDANVPIGFWILTLNIPVFIVGSKYVSKKFALFSVVSVLMQTLLTSGIVPPITILEQTDRLFYAILGGMTVGLGAGLALRYGTSTGGLDVISQAISFNKGISIAMITLSFNFVIAIIGGGLIDGDIEIVLYSFIRIIITSLVVDKIHNQYSFIGLSILISAEKCDELSAVLLNELGRGVTIFEGEGAYTKKKRMQIYLVISTYEFPRVREIVETVDPKSFMVASPVKKVYGSNFKRKSIV